MLILEYSPGIEQSRIVISGFPYFKMAEIFRASALDPTRRLNTPIDPICTGNTNAHTFFPIPLKRHFPKVSGQHHVHSKVVKSIIKIIHQ